MDWGILGLLWNFMVDSGKIWMVYFRGVMDSVCVAGWLLDLCSILGNRMIEYRGRVSCVSKLNVKLLSTFCQFWVCSALNVFHFVTPKIEEIVR